jgi:hypothetical protein
MHFLATLTRIRHLQLKITPYGWNDLISKQPQTLVDFFLACRHPISSAQVHLKNMLMDKLIGFVKALAKVNK